MDLAADGNIMSEDDAYYAQSKNNEQPISRKRTLKRSSSIEKSFPEKGLMQATMNNEGGLQKQNTKRGGDSTGKSKN